MRSIRERRVESEWQTLLQIASLNPRVIAVEGRTADAGVDRFEIEVRRSGALIIAEGTPTGIDTYNAIIEFPHFFPAVPMQVFLPRPLLHPNIQPDTGFVCLWDQTSPGDSIIDALLRLQSIVSWKMFNDSPDHLMQPEAFQLYSSKQALPVERICVPQDLLDLHTVRAPMPGDMRRRLS